MIIPISEIMIPISDMIVPISEIISIIPISDIVIPISEICALEKQTAPQRRDADVSVVSRGHATLELAVLVRPSRRIVR